MIYVWQSLRHQPSISPDNNTFPVLLLLRNLFSQVPHEMVGVGGQQSPGFLAVPSSQCFTDCLMFRSQLDRVNRREEVHDHPRTDIEGQRLPDAEQGPILGGLDDRTVEHLVLLLERHEVTFLCRRNDGTPDIHSSGTLIDEQGRTEPLRSDQFQLIPEDRWRSPNSGARYPVLWTVRLVEKQTLLRVQAAFPDQEMNTLATIGTPYWEGSVIVTGTWEGEEVRGQGYLEMTGYRGRGLGGVYD